MDVLVLLASSKAFGTSVEFALLKDDYGSSGHLLITLFLNVSLTKSASPYRICPFLALCKS